MGGGDVDKVLLNKPISADFADLSEPGIPSSVTSALPFQCEMIALILPAIIVGINNDGSIYATTC
jgi:hypothetical protein